MKLIILGTSNAIPSPNHENTHMIFVGKTRTILVDCVSDPIVRLEQAGVDYNALTDIILTHFHPDHVSGVPLLLMDMWLLGRTKPLDIYGLEYTLERIEHLMELYNWHKWPNFFPVRFHRIKEKELAPVLDCPEVQIFASPVQHMVPNIGLRFEFKESRKTLAYSCDTEPCPQVIQLAAGADILIHEATGAGLGHSSAAQAGEAARQAEVGTLYLIHYPTGQFTNENIVQEAQTRFGGTVIQTEDFMEITLE
jgi:ribonuclease Z